MRRKLFCADVITRARREHGYLSPRWGDDRCCVISAVTRTFIRMFPRMRRLLGGEGLEKLQGEIPVRLWNREARELMFRIARILGSDIDRSFCDHCVDSAIVANDQTELGDRARQRQAWRCVRKILPAKLFRQFGSVVRKTRRMKNRGCRRVEIDARRRSLYAVAV